jgi:hypothetical protein
VQEISVKPIFYYLKCMQELDTGKSVAWI